MKIKALLASMGILLTISILAQDIDEIKFLDFTTGGQIGGGRSSGYVPCYEPFYLRIDKNQIPGKVIRSVKVKLYDSQGKKAKEIIPITYDGASKIVPASPPTFVTSSIYNVMAGGTKQPKSFSSTLTSDNKLLIYVNAQLNYRRYYYIDWEVEYELTPAVATAVVGAGGAVTSILVSNPGSGYVNAPTISINEAGVAGSATANAIVKADGTIDIILTSGGSGYTAAGATVVIQNNNVAIEKHEENRIRSTALKNDIAWVEAYTGFGIPVFGGKDYTTWRPGWAFVGGAKIHFGPVYHHPSRSRYALSSWLSRFSVTIGAALGKLNYKNTEIQEITDFINPVFGIDFEPFKYASIHIGTVLGVQNSSSAAISEKKLVAGMFFGINITPEVFKNAASGNNRFKFPSVNSQP